MRTARTPTRQTGGSRRPGAVMGTFGPYQPAHYDHIQRRPQGLGDLEGHRNATPRQANNHNTLTAQMPQSRGQAPSRIGTIFGNPRLSLSAAYR